MLDFSVLFLYSMDVGKMYNKPSLTLIVGGCESGKTFLTNYLMNQCCKKKLFQFGIIFSLSATNNTNWDMFPTQYIYEGYQEDILKKYIKKLNDWKQNNNKKPAPPNFVIFDDIMGSLRNTPFFESFLSTH